MLRTRGVNARIPEDLEQRARKRHPELSDVEISTLVRVGLAVLAGDDSIPAALETARTCVYPTGGRRGGPAQHRPRKVALAP